MPQVPPRVLSKTEDVLTVARKVHEVTAKLRQHEEVVTPETGKLREQLIAALREEEFCMARLAVLRKSQAQDVKFLASLRKAIG
ncbi:unnamed protein product [Symbiodinium sp. KB8]|nr:unnamed protein product [Symbiodinium sp. KB8]